MPVQARVKLDALVSDFGSQARVADVLEVDRSRVSRWLKGEQPDAENSAKLDRVEFVLSRLLGRYQPQTALKWLQGINPQLGDRRPVDLIRSGRVAEVLEAVETDLADAYA